MAKVEKMLEELNDLYNYCDTMFILCHKLLNNRKDLDEDALIIVRKFRLKYMSKNIDELDVPKNKMLILKARFLSGTSSRDIYFKRSETQSDCDPVFRRWYVEYVLKLYRYILSEYDANYVIEYDPPYFRPPASYKGMIYVDFDYSKVDDEATRIAFKEFLQEKEKRENRNQIHEIQHAVNRAWRRNEFLRQTLVSIYSLHPFRTSELVELMKKHELEPEIVKDVLEGMTYMEKRYPEDGFRIWQSKDKLFKADAKFIEVKNNEAILEKRNKNRTSIEINVLRHDDQEYIKRITKK
jgi:hypothetical protein